MEAWALYKYLYKLLEDVTPLDVDCGKLCGAACCKGDEDTGMYLFPFEEVMYDGNEDWIKIYDSDFYFRGKPVKIAICNGKCQRDKRPLSCRIFPLFLGNDNKLKTDARACSMCPLVAGNIDLSEYNPEFIKNVSKVFDILCSIKTTAEYIKETQKIIDEFEGINDIFK